MNSNEDKIRSILPPKGKKFLLVALNESRARSFVEELSAICNMDMRHRIKTVYEINDLRGWAGSTTIILLDNYQDNRSIRFGELWYMIKGRRLNPVEFNQDLLRNIQSIENYE